MNLPKTTARQREILDLLYSYRFLTRSQIQAFMGHTDKRRISAWVLDLREKHYLEWIYDPKDFYAKTRPAIYYMGLNGIRYHLANHIHQVEQIRIRYRESSRSQSYIDHSLLIADCSITLTQASNNQVQYYTETEADYMRENDDEESLRESELIHPHLCYLKYVPEAADNEAISCTYLMEVFDANYPRFRMLKRLKGYIEYLDDDHWESHLQSDIVPMVLIVCPRLSDLIYAKRRTRGIYRNQSIQDKDTLAEDRLHIRFTTAEKLKAGGILAADIWEEA